MPITASAIDTEDIEGHNASVIDHHIQGRIAGEHLFRRRFNAGYIGDIQYHGIHSRIGGRNRVKKSFTTA